MTEEKIMTTKKKPIQSNPVKDDKNDVVFIQLDRLREVRFGHKSLKRLGVLLGKNMANFNENDFDLGDIEKVMFCGLQQDAAEHGETLELEMMEDLLDQAKSYGDIMKAMNDALNNAFQETEKQKN
jgi:hypothetical protein